MKKLSSLSVFFPSYNDSKTLPRLLAQIYEILPQITNDYEVIVVNDGSSDNTTELLEKLAKKYKNLKPIHNEKRSGYGGALKCGFKNATKEWIFYTDGDGQYNPYQLLKLVELVQDETNVGQGYKSKRSDTFSRRMLGNCYNLLVHILYRPTIRDVDCDFRLIPNKLLRKIKLKSDSGLICLELILKLKKVGARFRETEVSHHKRLYGKSTFFTLGNITHLIFDHLRFFITSRF